MTGPLEWTSLLRWLGLAALLAVLLSMFSCRQAELSLARDLAAQLQRQLPEKLDRALQNRFFETDVLDLVEEMLNRDLAVLAPTGPLPLFGQCRGRVQQLLEREAGGSPVPRGEIALDWQLGREPVRTRIAVDCDTNWPALIGSQSLLALLFAGLLSLLPAPLSRRRRVWLSVLRDEGVAGRQALALSARLEAMNEIQRSLFSRLNGQLPLAADELLQWLETPGAASLSREQEPWFLRALQIHGNMDLALACARAPLQLQFDTAACAVSVRGIPLKLSKTPFFYYLWYARHRLQGNGWLLNPPTNRADRGGAVSLIELMESCGGHNKAINDLRENGLRAKILDQNRNKIKDELVSSLGEELAGDFLFETERDLKTGRYRYRIAAQPAQIAVLEGAESVR